MLGILAGAVVIEVVSPVVPLIGLRDLHRPVPGGVQIEGGGGLCSVMVNANTPAGAGFITASHCTWALFGMDAALFHQPNSFNLIGVEVADPAPIPTGQACPASLGLPCRYSDAAFIAYDFGVQGHRGTIARTNGLGNITINNNLPRFLISEPGFGFVPVGTEVNKIGRTTGWTAGDVLGTCIDISIGVPAATHRMLCQQSAAIHANPGDSGSPIFTWDGFSSNVDVRGILHAGGGGVTYFSKWLYISLEVGNLVGNLAIEYGGGVVVQEVPNEIARYKSDAGGVAWHSRGARLMFAQSSGT